MNLLTCFKTLGLPSDADAARAKQAYKAQVKRWHPDRFPEGSDEKIRAEEQLKQINVAYALVKEHLAAHQPAMKARKPAAPTHPEKTDKGDARQTQERKRSWVDALFNALNAFVGDRDAASSPPPQEKGQTNRKPSFGQVLDEMAGGRISPPKGRRKGKSGNYRHNAAGYRRRRRGGGSVGAVGSAERPGPVRPVGRVRGIGKSR